MSESLYDDETRSQVVAAYKSGEKIAAMEKRLGIPRSSIYWILEQSGQMPPKMRRANRLVGDRQQLAHLFELLETQNKYIQELEAKLNLCEGEPDDDTE